MKCVNFTIHKYTLQVFIGIIETKYNNFDIIKIHDDLLPCHSQ
jgi:hypothetical protein